MTLNTLHNRWTGWSAFIVRPSVALTIPWIGVCAVCWIFRVVTIRYPSPPEVARMVSPGELAVITAVNVLLLAGLVVEGRKSPGQPTGPAPSPPGNRRHGHRAARRAADPGQHRDHAAGPHAVAATPNPSPHPDIYGVMRTTSGLLSRNGPGLSTKTCRAMSTPVGELAGMSTGNMASPALFVTPPKSNRGAAARL